MFSGMSNATVQALHTGGPVVLVLCAFSALATVIVVAKLWQFAHLRLNATDLSDDALKAWRRGYPQQAVGLLASARRRPIVRVVDVAMRGLLSDRGIDTVREEVTRVARNQVARLRHWLRVLDLIAVLSPLLGLLGTVLGMIEAFRQLEQAGDQVNPALLSGGIWQALLTTAIGLCVAIPVLIAHQLLERRVEHCAHAMEDAATRVFTTVPWPPDQREEATREMRGRFPFAGDETEEDADPASTGIGQHEPWSEADSRSNPEPGARLDSNSTPGNDSGRSGSS